MTEVMLAEALVTHALERLGGRTVYAFEFASALSLGLEGLPVHHLPATRRALESAGFTGRDLWRYMRADLSSAGLPRLAHCTVEDSADPVGKRLGVREGGQVLAGLEAREVILYIDEDAPTGDAERDRTAANAL